MGYIWRMKNRSPSPKRNRRPNLAFAPVALRPRHDGWTADRQTEFIEALADCGCVVDAARRVGMGVESAYRLRSRPDAQAFRVAWDLALDYAIRRLSDAAFSRALHGTVVPHFYKGEQVGEHRRFDSALTRFLLRYRDPVRYARTRDAMDYDQHPDGPALALATVLNAVKDAANGRAVRLFDPPPSTTTSDKLGGDVP